jgi:hypothetical protein
MKKIVILIFLLVTSIAIYAQESFSTVEERMTGKEFMDSGLSKLTDSELVALNKWLRDHSVATMEDRAVSSRSPVTSSPGAPAQSSSQGAPAQASSPAATVATTTSGDKRGFEDKDLDKTVVVSPLIGEFKGWDGETIFKLQNGMIWKQTEKGRQITKLLINPVVTITPGMFNSWHLTVEGYNRNVQVDRIQ